MPRDIVGGVVRNIFILRQLENALARDVIDEFIEALFDDLVAEIARIDPTGPQAERFRRMRVEKLLDRIAAKTGATFDEIAKALRAELAKIGVQQSEWAAGQLRTAVGRQVAIDLKGIGLNLMKHILDTDPFVGARLGAWAENQSRATVFRIRQQIQLGMAQGEGIDAIVRRVRGRRSGRRFVDGVLQTTTRQATTIVRTAVNHISNAAHLETYRNNVDVVTRMRYTATLDSRTSDICIALDGREWPVDSDTIRRPPQHVNCRSVLTPVVDWRGLGLEPPEEGRRASADGPVPASTTYSEWLRDQPAAVQDEILGPGRAKLFRAGKIDLRELVTRDGRTKRLDELAA